MVLQKQLRDENKQLREQNNKLQEELTEAKRSKYSDMISSKYEPSSSVNNVSKPPRTDYPSSSFAQPTANVRSSLDNQSAENRSPIPDRAKSPLIVDDLRQKYNFDSNYRESN